MQALPAHIITPFDLHVLGTPPAFILSQDQTLNKKLSLPKLNLALFPALEVLFQALPRLGFMVSFFWNFFEFHELCSRIFRVALLFDCQGTSKADRCAIILESLLSQNVLCNEMLCDSTQRAVFSASCPCFCVASFCLCHPQRCILYHPPQWLSTLILKIFQIFFDKLRKPWFYRVFQHFFFQ